MKLLVVAIAAAVGMWPSAQAWADQPALRLSNLSAGNQPVGSVTLHAVTATNQGSGPIQLNGSSLTGLGSEPGIGGFDLAFTGCSGLLSAGQACTSNILFIPLATGTFRSRFCLFTFSGDYCEIVRGHAN
jgi:hypothetical protein